MFRFIKARRGLKIRCKGWKQEGILRMLENSIECGTNPEKLITYHSNAKVARNWNCYDRIVKNLIELEEDETLVIQSGKPVLVTKTNKQTARVIHVNCTVLGKWATSEYRHYLEEKGLTMFGSVSGAAWSHSFFGIELPATYELLKMIGKEYFEGTLKGKMMLTAGLGGAGLSQPVAYKMNEGVCLIIEVNEQNAKKAKKEGLIDIITNNLDEALNLTNDSLKKQKASIIVLIGNTGDIYPEILKRNIIPDIVTDQTPYDNLPYGIIPFGMSLEEADYLRKENPGEFMKRVQNNAIKVAKAILDFKNRGSIVYDYGTGIRDFAVSVGLKEASQIDYYGVVYTRKNILKGRDFFRWVALSGDPEDIIKIDKAVINEFEDDEVITNWIKKIKQVPPPSKGLPEGTHYLLHSQRRIAIDINEMVREGILKAPIVMYRGCFTHFVTPTISTGLNDDSDYITDWVYLISMLTTAVGADYVAQIGMGTGDACVSRWFAVLDGTKETEKRLETVLRVDTDFTIARYADAGYETPQKLAKKLNVRIPRLRAL